MVTVFTNLNQTIDAHLTLGESLQVQNGSRGAFFITLKERCIKMLIIWKVNEMPKLFTKEPYFNMENCY